MALLVVVAASAGCASSRLERRVAQLEQELKAARTAPLARRSLGEGGGAMTAGEAVALGNLTAAANAPTFVAFVDERPALCRGALCWEIRNGHNNPVVLSINGRPVTVVGEQGPFLPAQSRAYIRLVDPGQYTLTYNLHDSVSVGDHSPELPVATVIARCRAEAYVGGSVDAYWGNHATHLDGSFCY
jgi:hypothetical protein